MKDTKAFVFSLVNQIHKPFKLALASHWRSRICIASDSNANEESYSDVVQAHVQSGFRFGSEEEKYILAGSKYFQTLEIEVFTQN